MKSHSGGILSQCSSQRRTSPQKPHLQYPWRLHHDAQAEATLHDVWFGGKLDPARLPLSVLYSKLRLNNWPDCEDHFHREGHEPPVQADHALSNCLWVFCLASSRTSPRKRVVVSGASVQPCLEKYHNNAVCRPDQSIENVKELLHESIPLRDKIRGAIARCALPFGRNCCPTQATRTSNGLPRPSRNCPQSFVGDFNSVWRTPLASSWSALRAPLVE